jgi:hypothetical protein
MSVIRNIETFAKSKELYVWVVIVLPYFAVYLSYCWYRGEIEKVKGATIVLVSKKEMMLYLYDYNGQLIQKSSISCGKAYGDKKKSEIKKPQRGFFI